MEISAFGINFSQFKGILDLKYFNSMYKTHPRLQDKNWSKMVITPYHIFTFTDWDKRSGCHKMRLEKQFEQNINRKLTNRDWTLEETEA